MKYAALIFGDDDRQPKAASVKLSSPEPGQIVRAIDGSVYRVASKLASPDGVVVKLSSLHGELVRTPPNFRPVGSATSHFASWLKYHLAYNRDFDLYVNAYIEKYNETAQEPLPYPTGRDGKAFRWANWFDKIVAPKLFVRGGGDAKDKQAVKDDVIHDMLFTTLGQRNVLSQFAAKADSLGANKQNAAGKLTDFLISTFMYRISEMQGKINAMNPTLGDPLERQIRYQRELYNEAKANKDRAGMARATKKIKDIEAELEGMEGMSNTPVEISMWQPTDHEDEDETGNILEQEQYGVGEVDFESADAKRDVEKFREGFKKWLVQTEGKAPGENLIAMFDLFWDALQEHDEIKRGDIEQDWITKTGLSFGAFKSYFSRLPEMVERYIESHRAELGDKSIFVQLMNAIKAEREQGETKKRREKERARPAMVSSLHIAGVEEDFVEANKAVVSPLKEASLTKKAERKLNPQLGSAHNKIAQRLLRGDELDPDQRKQVEAAFIYRWTSDNKRRGDVYHCDKCDVRQNPYVNEQSAEGHQHPTIPLQTDNQWLSEHAFYFTNAGRLLPNRHAVPAYLAQEKESIIASVAHKFAMEKAAYNPGMAEYIYQADVYCEDCGKKLVKKLWGTANDQGDSDSFPQGPFYQQEADGPQHCAKCGRFLENPLTSEGYRYLNQMILEHEADGKGQSDIIDEWKAFYPEREEQEYTAGRQVDEALDAVEHDTDKDFLRGMNTSSKKAMLPHDFNNADGQAIRPETNIEDTGRVEGETDRTEFTEPRMGAEEEPEEEDKLSVAKAILQQLGGNKFRAMTGAKNFVGGSDNLTFRLPGSGGFTKNGINAVQITLDPSDTYTVAFSRMRGGVAKVVSMHRDVYAENLREVFEQATGLYTSLGTMGNKNANSEMVWKCMDCDSVGKLSREGNCEVCDSQAVYAIPPEVPWKCQHCGHVGELADSGGCNACGSQKVAPDVTGVPVREVGPEEVEERMAPVRERRAIASKKTAQGSGNTTVTMQNQNVTTPNTPGKGQPLAVPDAINQAPGPHSPNAPMTAPRSPGLHPRIVDVPAGTVGDDAMSATAAEDEPEEIRCPKCHGTHVDVDGAGGDEGFQIYCEDCEATTYTGMDVPKSRPSGGDEFSRLEQMGQIEGELGLDEGPIEPDFDLDYEAERLGEIPKGAAGEDIYRELEEEGRQDKELSEQMDSTKEFERVYALPQEQREAWLVEHGWVKDEEWHGASWWMQKPMWSKKDYEESIPYQTTDDAIEKEFELLDEPDFDTEHDAERLGEIPDKTSAEECEQCGAPLNNAEGELCGQCQAEGAEDREDPFDKMGGLWEKESPNEKEAEAMAYEIAPSGCTCPNNGAADCPWCEAKTISLNMLTEGAPKTADDTCPSGKAKYDDENAALWAIEVQNGKRQKQGLAQVGLYVYKCPSCGFFHLTKNEQKLPSVKNPPPPPSDEQQWREEAERMGFGSVQAAGSNSGDDDARGVGDLYRENFYEHRTEGLSTNGMLSGMKKGAACCPLAGKPVHDAVIQLAEVFKMQGKDAANELAKTLLPPSVKRWEMIAIGDAIREHASKKTAAAPAVAPPVNPNVAQQQALHSQINSPQQPGAGGAFVAITPGQEQGEEPGNLRRHTVEPELPNAKYHMMSTLASAEEDRLLAEDPEYKQWLDQLNEAGQGTKCEECDQAKPDVQWHEFPDLGNIHGTGQLEGWFCENCALEIAQDI